MKTTNPMTKAELTQFIVLQTCRYGDCTFVAIADALDEMNRSGLVPDLGKAAKILRDHVLKEQAKRRGLWPRVSPIEPYQVHERDYLLTHGHNTD